MIRARILLIMCALLRRGEAQPSLGALQISVTDPSDAAIPGASVTITGANAAPRAGKTDVAGQLRVDAIPAGGYTVRVASPNFTPFERARITISPGRVQTLSVRLEIQGQTSKVTVSDNAGLSVEASQNAGQLVLKGSDLDSLSDDAEDLSNELQMLAGPAVGPDGGQIYIDGFSGGRMPPKQSIREIRVNQNPFSSEYDRVGFGRVEVFTKPGADRYHGQASFDFGNRALTARNPYLVSPIVPNYRQEMFSGNVSGPLSKKASFFIDADRRITDENSLLNYTDLDASYRSVGVSGAVVAPSRRFSTSPRLDFSLTPNDTLMLRYSFTQTSAKNQGITSQGFDQASRAYGADTTEQTAQITNSIVLGQKAENDTRFQFFRTRTNLRGVSSEPEIDVQGAFTGGGTFALNYTDRDRYEFQDTVMLLRGTHTIKFGGRLRDDRLAQQSETNFNGRFIFTAQPGAAEAIDIYQQNRMLAAQGVPEAQIAAAGFGPSEFLLTAGRPLTAVSLFDAGVFLQDDWRLKPNLSLSGGLRYEGQSRIADHADFAPRLGLAWAPAGSRANAPKTVIRVGAGIFYDRFTADLLLNAAQLNGVNQMQFIVRSPTFFPDVPSVATLTALTSQQGAPVRVVNQIDSRFHVPYLLQSAIGIERQLPRNISLAVNYAYTRGLHELRTRDINAPYPVQFDVSGRAVGPRPYGDAAGDLYQYEGSGSFRQQQVIVSVTARISSRISAYGYYVYGRAMSDTDGAATQPANPYDLHGEYGRAAYDNRHRGFISATANLPLRIRMAPFLFLQSGRPYSVTSGVDSNNDGNPNDDRPAFATNLSRPTVVTIPGFGAFDTAPGTLPNGILVPRNYLEGPGILSLTVRLSRSWTFGESGKGGGNTGGDDIRGGESIRLGGNSNQRGLASVFGGVATAKRYNLTLTASIRNALNNVNPATPIGNLSSPFFGKSIALNTFGPLPGAGPNAGAGNRHIELQLRLTF
jgi:Carboxypeptidase regulatory-like domain/TonB dependent receptor